MQQVIQNLPAGVFLVMLAFAAAFVAIPLVAASKAQQEMAALSGVRATSIAQAGDGYVRVEGHARRLEGVPVKASLTGADVVWFHSRVEDSRDPYGKSAAGKWRTITDEESDEEFVVQDSSGSVLIYPAGARVTPTDRSIWYGATPLPEDRNPKKFRPGENPKGDGLQIEWSAGSTNRYRYTEERIYPGDPIYVQGDCAARIDGEDDEKDAPPPSPITRTIGKAIARPRHREPFLISTTAPDTMNEMYRGGIGGAQIIAAMFAMLLVGLLWLRFS